MKLKSILLNEVCKQCGCEKCECGNTNSFECGDVDDDVEEVAPEGREDQVIAIKKSIATGKTPKTYVDKKSGKRKKSNAFAISWSAKNKGYK